MKRSDFRMLHSARAMGGTNGFFVWFFADDIPIQIDASTGHNAQQSNQPLGSINEEQENDPNNSKTQQGKSGKDGSKSHKAPFGAGFKKLIDREKDKDKDKDKEKEKSSIKSGLSETKESVKKLMGKDKQNSKATLLQAIVEPETQIHNNNNGDVKNTSNSPMVMNKRSSDIISDSAIDMATLNDKSLPDIVNMSKLDGAVNNGSHGIISPFESLNNDDSDSDEALVDPPHHQLSSSSSASINIMMDNTNTKLVGNVQVSQV